MPEVSVVIPTFNAAHFLPQALDSVLAQTFRDIEVLVVDDGSTDGTAELMQRYAAPTRYLRQENQGVACARNRGIEQSRGTYVAFLDADDAWRPEKIERQLGALAAKPGARAIHTAFEVVGTGGRQIVRRISRDAATLTDLLTVGNVIGTPSTVLCARALLLEAGGFDPAFSQCADWEMWIRLAARTEFLYIDEPLAEYRQHSANMSRDPALLEHDSVRVLERGFAIPDLPPALRELKRRALGHNYTVLAGGYLHARRPISFMRCVGAALARDPRQIAYMLRFPWRRLRRRTGASA